MIYEYDDEYDETHAKIGDETFATIDGKVTRWRNGIPHPDTEAYETFQDALLELDSPSELRVILHLIAGDIQRNGFYE